MQKKSCNKKLSCYNLINRTRCEFKKGGERMINVNKLRGKIIEMGLNVKELADNLEMDRSTLYRKMNSEGDTMTISDAVNISRILKLNLDEVNAIFFSDFVA